MHALFPFGVYKPLLLHVYIQEVYYNLACMPGSSMKIKIESGLPLECMTL